MSWLALWFIFELKGVESFPDLSVPHALKNVSLQMMVDQTFTFPRIFCLKIAPHSSFEVRYKWR